MSTEDISTFTESDPSSLFTLSSSSCIFEDLEYNSKGYVYKDYDAGHFGDFEHLILCNHVDSTGRTDKGCLGGVWGVTNNPDEYGDLTNGLIAFLYKSSNDGLGYPETIYLKDVGTPDDDSWTGASASSVYFLTIERNGTTGTCKIYDDPSRTTLKDTLTVTCENTTYRYLMAGFAWGNASGDYNHDMDGYSGEFDLQEPEPSSVSYFKIVNDDSTNSVQFEIVTGISQTHTKIVNTYVFTDDSDEILDEGKSIDQLIITGVDSNNFSNVLPVGTIYSRANIVNQLMDDQEIVTIKGLDDTYQNDDFVIKSFSFNQKAGEPEVYGFNITFERVRDRLPYSEI